MAATKTLSAPFGNGALGALSGAGQARVLEFTNGTRRITVVADSAFYFQVNSALDDDDAVADVSQWYGEINAGVHYVIELGGPIKAGTKRVAVTHNSGTPNVRYHVEGI